MKLDLEKAKKCLKEFKEELGMAVAELMDGVFVENAADDIIDSEIVDIDDNNKFKGKSSIPQAIERCYYSIGTVVLNKKLEIQEKMKEKIATSQEKEITKVEEKAKKSGLDLLSDQVIDDKAAVYQNSQEKMNLLDSDMEQTKTKLETYEQKINDIDNRASSTELNPVDTDILNQASEMESVSTQINPIEEQVEKQIETETSQQIGEEVQAMTDETEISQQIGQEVQVMADEPVNVEEKTPSKEELRNTEIEKIITSLNVEIEEIYQSLNNKISETYQALNNEVNSSYEQITNKTQAAMKKLELLKEDHRKQDIKLMAEQSENMIRSVGTKLAKAEARQTETTANLEKAEGTILSQETDIKDMTNQINNLNETVATKDKEIESLKRELAIQEQKNLELTNKNKRLTVTVATLKDLEENPQEDIDMDGLLSDENQVEQTKTK